MRDRVNDKMNGQSGRKDDQKMRRRRGVQKKKRNKGQITALETQRAHCEIPVSGPN